MAGLTRRQLLASAGVAGAGLGLGAGGFALGRESAEPEGTGSVEFFGAHQAGIATAAQDRLHFASFDLATDRVEDLRELFQVWTAAAIEMTRGELIGDENTELLAPPDDTGETYGLNPSRLTVTFGIGPDVFEQDGRDRFGLKSKRPPSLKPIPALPGDELVPGQSGGDLCVQACAEDPQVAFHAIRNLARIGRGTVVMRWSQLGFGRSSSTGRDQETPRNLMGFKDGTNNIRSEETDAMDRYVWFGSGSDLEWMRGGSIMVTRRIRILMEIWDRSSLGDQEQTIGRSKYSGAPLGGKSGSDQVDLDSRKGGKPLIPANAHIRVAAPETNHGQHILRRGYSFTDGVDEKVGQLDAGLFFICFQRDPEKQFIPIQTRLGTLDALNEYIKHVSSAIFAIPPGATNGGYVGETLFD